MVEEGIDDAQLLSALEENVPKGRKWKRWARLQDGQGQSLSPLIGQKRDGLPIFIMKDANVANKKLKGLNESQIAKGEVLSAEVIWQPRREP